MARRLNGSNEYLQRTAAIVARPFAMGCWFRADGITTNIVLMSIGSNTVNLQYHDLRLAGGDAGDYLKSFSRNSATYDNATTTTSVSSTTAWYHALCIHASATDRRVYLNGGGKGTNSTSVSPSSADRTLVGALQYGIADIRAWWDGAIAEVAVWDLSGWPGSTDSERADSFEASALPGLSAGYLPLFFPLGLVAYWPLGGYYDANDGDHDIVGGLDLTPVNSPTTEDHGMLYVSPATSPIVVPAGAAFAGVSRILGSGLLA